MYEEGRIKVEIQISHVAVMGLDQEQEDDLSDRLEVIYGSKITVEVPSFRLWVEGVGPDEVGRAVRAVLMDMDIGYSLEETTIW